MKKIATISLFTVMFTSLSVAGPLDDMSNNPDHKHFEAAKRAAAACINEIEKKLVGHAITVFGPCIRNDQTLNSFVVKSNGYELKYEVDSLNKKTILVICNTDFSVQRISLEDRFKTISDHASMLFYSGEDMPGLGGRCYGTYIK